MVTIGEYFLDKKSLDEFNRFVNLAFNFGSTFKGVVDPIVDWSKVGKGFWRKAWPGIDGVRDGKWQTGWTGEAAEYWFGPAYDSLHSNKKLAFNHLISAGPQYYLREAGLAHVGDVFAAYYELFRPNPVQPSFENYYGAPFRHLCASVKQNLSEQYNRFMTDFSSLNLPTSQYDSLLADLRTRTGGSTIILEQLFEHTEQLNGAYLQSLADEQDFLKQWSPILINWAIIGVATVYFDGPGFYVASAATGTSDTIREWIRDTRAINTDDYIIHQSLNFFEQAAPRAAMQVNFNIVTGFELIRQSARGILSPQIPAVTSGPITMKSYGYYRLWGLTPWWIEESSEIEWQLSNTASFETDLEAYVAYNQTNFWKGTQYFVVNGEPLHLNPNESGKLITKLKTISDAESPKIGSVVSFITLGDTYTGKYYISERALIWNPERVETQQAVNLHINNYQDSTLSTDVPVAPHPLSSALTFIPVDNQYHLSVFVLNPFTNSVTAQIRQSLPPQFTVVDPGSASITENVLVWNIALQPGSTFVDNITISWPNSPEDVVTMSGVEMTLQGSEPNQSANFSTSSRSVSGQLPILVQFVPPIQWKFEEITTLTVTLQNYSDNMSLNGDLILAIEDGNSQTLFSNNQTIQLLPSSVITTSFDVQLPSYLGLVGISAKLDIGSKVQTLFYHPIYLPGRSIYLPLIYRN